MFVDAAHGKPMIRVINNQGRIQDRISLFDFRLSNFGYGANNNLEWVFNNFNIVFLFELLKPEHTLSFSFKRRILIKKIISRFILMLQTSL